jgi:hypothetical protein
MSTEHIENSAIGQSLSANAGRNVATRASARSGFIIGPVADSLLIIGAPLVALVIALPLFALPRSVFKVSILGEPADARQVFVLTFILAHLVLVYFRSHANGNIFRTYPFRFTVVPIGLVVATALSPWIMGIAGVIAVWWDVYHSSLQTFGFGRIYDARQKNGPDAGRRLDYWMNLLIYTGPVLGGVHFAEHVQSSCESLQFLSGQQSLAGDLLLRRGPAYLTTNQWWLSVTVLSLGLPFIAYYMYSYFRLQQQGYHVSWQKCWLLAITGSVSIYVWGFCTIIDAFWVMNFFHALQYFAIVGFTEQTNLARLFRLDRYTFGKGLALTWVVAICFLYGLWAGYYATGVWMNGIVVTTSIMHFWYDSFIWSVKRKQI